MEVNFDIGEVGEWNVIWNGIGGFVFEGLYIYYKDGWYYFLVVEGKNMVIYIFCLSGLS